MTEYVLTVYPVTLHDNGNPFITIVGGDTALSDNGGGDFDPASDSTYVQCTNLAEVASNPPTIQFPGISLPSSATDTTIQFLARYQQVSGPSIGRPVMTWDVDPAVTLYFPHFTILPTPYVDQTVDLSVDPAVLFPNDLITPTMWDLGFDFDINAACDFRIYWLSMTLVYSLPGASPSRRKYPRDDGLGVGPGRHYPQPTSQQASNRRAGGYF